jgi:hypothetical protein
MKFFVSLIFNFSLSHFFYAYFFFFPYHLSHSTSTFLWWVFRDSVSCTIYPGLALNCDPFDLCLLRSYDYRCEPLAPGYVFFLPSFLPSFIPPSLPPSLLPSFLPSFLSVFLSWDWCLNSGFMLAK